MVKTSAPEHVLTGTLGRLSLDVGTTGLFLGKDGAGWPVPLRVFGPGPTTVAFVGGWWAAHVLVFRCLAVGALVAVRATGIGDVLADQTQWTALDRAAGGAGNRVWPMTAEHAMWLPADATAPMLHVYDVGPAGPPTRPVLGPWQTQLTVLPRLTPASAHALTMADVVVVQRLTEPEVTLAAAAVKLDADTRSMLAALDDDMVAVLGDNRPAWLLPTSIERQLFGDPRR